MEIDARIVATALKLLGIQSLEDQPKDSILSPAIKEASIDTRKAFLRDCCFKVVDKFVVREVEMKKLVKKLEKENEADVGMLPNGRFPCRYGG